MDPRIQYAQTSDGAGIAFWQLGEGPALIQMPSIPFSHIQMEWADPDWRAWYELLGVDLKIIRYDPRGCGLSSPAPGEMSLEAMVEDVRAVAQRAGCERFSLLAPVQAAPAAITLAARFPQAVTHLVLWCGISRGDELRTSSFEALRTLSRTDWGLFSEAAAHALVAGWDQAEAAHRMAAIMRESSNAKVHEAVMERYLAADITAELAAVACPTLVAYRTQGTAPLPASARYLAAAIRESTLLPFPGSSLLFVGQGAEHVSSAFRSFLQVQARGHAPNAQSGFQTLLYTDIEGHSAIIQRLGDELGRAVLREHERITREVIASHNGIEVLATVDGFLVRFSTAQAALECSASLQRSLADAGAELPVELRVRIGINAGEPILEGAELHGASVLNTERIAGQADGGQVLVANVVRELAAGKNFAFADRGSAILPGLDEPIRLYELLWAHTAT